MGHTSFLCKVKVTIEGHKGQILGQNSDLTYFQHMAFWEIMVNEVESDCISYAVQRIKVKKMVLNLLFKSNFI